MDTTRIAAKDRFGGEEDAIHVRIIRGLDHNSRFAEQIERDDTGEFVRYRIPSSGKPGLTHLVELRGAEEFCSCADFRHNGRELRCCRHTIAALVAEAKRPATYRIEEQFDSRVGTVYALINEKTGKTVGVRPNRGDAYLDKLEMLGFNVEAA